MSISGIASEILLDYSSQTQELSVTYLTKANAEFEHISRQANDVLLAVSSQL